MHLQKPIFLIQSSQQFHRKVNWAPVIEMYCQVKSLSLNNIIYYKLIKVASDGVGIKLNFIIKGMCNFYFEMASNIPEEVVEYISCTP